MPTLSKPSSNVEWVPIVFIAAACYIITLLVFVPNVSDAALQGAIGIATTFGGAAAGAYGSKMMNRNLDKRATDRTATDAARAVEPDPAPIAGQPQP